MSDKTEYTPWKKGTDSLKESLPKHKTLEVDEGMSAIRGVREKMGEVLKKDQALKISMYNPPRIQRKEGETWTDANGKKWIRKGNINQSISKLQNAKTPWWCPKCKKIMNTRLDSKFWYKKGTCFDCVITEENEMRLNGTFEEYERKALYSNVIAKVVDQINEFKDLQQTVSNPQMHFQDGRFEEWDTDIEQVKKDLQVEIEKLEGRLEELQYEVKTGKVAPKAKIGKTPRKAKTGKVAPKAKK